ncbi:hypothetical protein HBI56_189490 [Parastagonospora nodorum]|uniref:Uncharacterized protein n=2 Tax=Phaeosphaeria nodorum (strain SN15 / ATCC MYA-4574 / FGSC 10173) TaxID=321614 RepID=A0A7U2F9U4_PHANO|nr:hypothetical protein SNOG_20131 [Parastagonospora nodorum SN15]KAH3910691.1 hypothetical protein HBH56_144970 [Parastagonospora nodorum]EDP89817.1 hypothetical protein SNOG_20131 [Parastagonospora nodorum SN15]KAH3927639.1 hypothetical protein HBH54_150160 [Parastagonospora nodorum]KAH3948073.1 hypothetical protein HBH53_110200 [Parastagonospora nodorum]KAH3960086.1 hypothetical protein HBH51_194020 [Parastagonospora nodorum]
MLLPRMSARECRQGSRSSDPAHHDAICSILQTDPSLSDPSYIRPPCQVANIQFGHVAHRQNGLCELPTALIIKFMSARPRDDGICKAPMAWE